MKKITLILISLASLSFRHAQSAEVRVRQSNAQVVDFIIGLQENRVMTLAEAMPAGKYSFAPQGDGFKGVRTFAEELKHIAADNYLLGAGILGTKPPAETGEGESGSSAVHTKSEILVYLKNSFEYMRRAAAAVDSANDPIPTPEISPWPAGKATRLGVAIEDCVHTYNHYGQLIEYLRMNGIVPPASRR
jgi:hypothetical protein